MSERLVKIMLIFHRKVKIWHLKTCLNTLKNLDYHNWLWKFNFVIKEQINIKVKKHNAMQFNKLFSIFQKCSQRRVLNDISRFAVCGYPRSTSLRTESNREPLHSQNLEPNRSAIRRPMNRAEPRTAIF